MTDIRLYLVELENNQKSEATQVAANTAKRLQTKELRLVELIESAGEYLNHENAVTRERGMLSKGNGGKINADFVKPCPFSGR